MIFFACSGILSTFLGSKVRLFCLRCLKSGVNYVLTMYCELVAIVVHTDIVNYAHPI